jgi:hypothetical protein
MDCRRCKGEGQLSIKLGRPDPDRDSHQTYLGPWCIYPPKRCMVCYGAGVEREKYNDVAMMRVHLNVDGIPTKRSAVADRETT